MLRLGTVRDDAASGRQRMRQVMIVVRSVSWFGIVVGEGGGNSSCKRFYLVAALSLRVEVVVVGSKVLVI